MQPPKENCVIYHRLLQVAKNEISKHSFETEVAKPIAPEKASATNAIIGTTSATRLLSVKPIEDHKDSMSDLVR